MGSRFHPYLVDWFDTGLAIGQFKVASGRHIILNQFSRLMPEKRLLASATVDPDSLRDFFRAINPYVVDLPDWSPTAMKRQLAGENDRLPALRKVTMPKRPFQDSEVWFVYTPPLDVMRDSWRDVRVQIGRA